MAEDPATQGNEKASGPSRIPVIAAGVAIAAAIGGGLWLTEPKPEPATSAPTTTSATSASPTPANAPDVTQATADPAPPSPPASGNVAIASAGGGNAVSFADESLTFSAALPNGPADDPALSYLRRDTEAYLQRMKASARADYDRVKKSGAKPNPWEVRIQWAYTAKTPELVSLAGVASEYAGGAHPIEKFDTYIGRAGGQQLKLNDMLLPQKNPSPALTIGICEALKAEKMQRIKSATILDEPITCAGFNSNAKTDEARIALAPSSTPGKFGGLFVYYDPYAVGAYAEGPYKLTVQQGVFADDLKPEFKAMFAGMAPESPN
ncbi:MAG TPA: RsiV family protein [Hyphomonadaceae bacterium]|nr:RsiV family protein [Hyphomonadaceae bacterium]